MTFQDIELEIADDDETSESGCDEWWGMQSSERAEWIHRVQNGEVSIADVAAAVSRLAEDVLPDM